MKETEGNEAREDGGRFVRAVDLTAAAGGPSD
jgi:hypothetical protein